MSETDPRKAVVPLGRGLFARPCRFNDVWGYLIELTLEKPDNDYGPFVGSVCRRSRHRSFRFEPSGSDDVRLSPEQLTTIAKFLRKVRREGVNL